MNPATAKAVRVAFEKDDREEARYLLALHAVNGCADGETLDDVETLVEAAFAPERRTFLGAVPEHLSKLRQEINIKRQSMPRFCRWCDQPIPRCRGASRYCSQSCAVDDLGEEPEEERKPNGR